MSWKPIPQEAPAKIIFKKTHISPRFEKHAIYKKHAQKPVTISYKLYQSVSMRLVEYIKRGGRYNLREIADLITDMQKTILNLQKKRLDICDKEHKKNKKKRNP
ncbi:hypothetical protein JW911_05180 [Candidatus Peregrinibacteria bacterium]|nr:hypothetical protein [Candidatus Peregrinibacteria bacterium]